MFELAGTRRRGSGHRRAQTTAALAALALTIAAPALAQGQGTRPMGARPAALVEDVRGVPPGQVEFMDYVYPGQVIHLGPGGGMVLFFFQSCRQESITGGRVVVGEVGSSAQGGTMNVQTVPCDTAKPVITAATGEAGAMVSRVTPFVDEDWSETTIRNDRPIFKWPALSPGEPAMVTVVYLDTKPARITWQVITRQSYFAYPDEAPPLKIGMPYYVGVRRSDGRELSTIFSVDPNLDVADTPANRVVRVGG